MKIQQINSNLSFKRVIVGNPDKQTKQDRVIAGRISDTENYRWIDAHGKNVLIDDEEEKPLFKIKNADTVTFNLNSPKDKMFGRVSVDLKNVKKLIGLSSVHLYSHGENPVEDVELHSKSRIEPTIIDRKKRKVSIKNAELFDDSFVNSNVTIKENGNFHDYSQNSGKIQGHAIFNDRSENTIIGKIDGRATFKHASKNRGEAKKSDFYDYSENYGEVEKAVFHDSSLNQKKSLKNVEYLDKSGFHS